MVQVCHSQRGQDVGKWRISGIIETETRRINKAGTYIIEEILNMIKTKALVFMTIIMLALTECGKVEQERLTVYSFSGENEQLTISNGIIVLNGTEEIFSGGDLK